MIILPSKVVILDDDTSYLETISSFLKRSGFDAVTFSNPVEASQYVAKNEEKLATAGVFDSVHVDDPEFERWVDRLQEIHEKEGIISCVISDYQMNDVDGLKWLSDQKCHAKKLLISGVFQDSQAVEALNNGVMKCYLQKGRKDFAEKLRQLLRESIFNFFCSINPKLLLGKGKEDFLKDLFRSNAYERLFPLSYPTIFSLDGGDDGVEKILHLFYKEDLTQQAQYAAECKASEAVIRKIEEAEAAFCDFARENEEEYTPDRWRAEDLTQLRTTESGSVLYAYE